MTKDEARLRVLLGLPTAPVTTFNRIDGKVRRYPIPPKDEEFDKWFAKANEKVKGRRKSYADSWLKAFRKEERRTRLSDETYISFGETPPALVPDEVVFYRMYLMEHFLVNAFALGDPDPFGDREESWQAFEVALTVAPDAMGPDDLTRPGAKRNQAFQLFDSVSSVTPFT